MARKSLKTQLDERTKELEEARKMLQVITSRPPLGLTVIVNRSSGVMETASNIDPGNQEPDVRLLLDAVSKVENSLHKMLIDLTEQRVRHEVEKQQNSPPGEEEQDNGERPDSE